MLEQWLDIKGYEGLYQVSSLGRVRSLDRVIIDKNNRKMNYRGSLMSLNRTTKNGYCQITLSKNGKAKAHYVHRLVAEAFLTNENNYKEVNHKNENKLDNSVNNLEWCDRKYNLSYGSRTKRMCETQGKKILAFKYENNEFVGEFVSHSEAQRILGLSPGSINQMLRGRVRQVKGYYFKNKQEG